MSSGPIMFARYAFPPNALGLCGPDDHQALLDHADSGASDGGLAELARGFEGAWPYLELIAGANGVRDPLDARVVEAYWLGGLLASRVRPTDLAHHAAQRFERSAGADSGRIAEAAVGGLTPTHGFHVFHVYPWTGLLRSGETGKFVAMQTTCERPAALGVKDAKGLLAKKK